MNKKGEGKEDSGRDKRLAILITFMQCWLYEQPHAAHRCRPLDRGRSIVFKNPGRCTYNVCMPMFVHSFVRLLVRLIIYLCLLLDVKPLGFSRPLFQFTAWYRIKTSSTCETNDSCKNTLVPEVFLRLFLIRICAQLVAAASQVKFV